MICFTYQQIWQDTLKEPIAISENNKHQILALPPQPVDPAKHLDSLITMGHRFFYSYLKENKTLSLEWKLMVSIKIPELNHFDMADQKCNVWAMPYR